MPRARVEVAVGDDPGDDVAFLLAANPGSRPLPLTKVASGGELARAMLALRLVLTEAPPTLVFDEVDAGIGGEAAVAVGQALARLGASHQVLVVTHLPQVAAAADAQIGVAKKQGRERTSTTITVLDDESRVIELSRMLCGQPDSEAAREHARELLSASDPGSADVSVAPLGADGVPVIVGHRPARPSHQEPRPATASRRHRDHRPRRPRPGRGRGLVEAGVGAVVNVASSMTGRYPNVGPLLVAAAGIPLIDEADAAVFDRVQRGPVGVGGGRRRGAGRRHGRARRAPRPERGRRSGSRRSRRTMGGELERFAENTLEYLRHEQHLLLDSPDLPDVPVDFEGRQVLMVVRGTDYREDLAMLRSSGYLSEMKPVLIGVDGGADALLEVGIKPDVIIGDFDSVSEQALRCGASLVVHAYADGDAPGAARLDALGLPYTPLPRGRHQRGHRHAAGLRAGRRADRGGRHPQLDGGVPRQGPRRAWRRPSWCA